MLGAGAAFAHDHFSCFSLNLVHNIYVTTRLACRSAFDPAAQCIISFPLASTMNFSCVMKHTVLFVYHFNVPESLLRRKAAEDNVENANVPMAVL